MEMIVTVSNNKDTAGRQLKNYDTGTIRLLKSLDERLTQLGARKVTVVNANQKG